MSGHSEIVRPAPRPDPPGPARADHTARMRSSNRLREEYSRTLSSAQCAMRQRRSINAPSLRSLEHRDVSRAGVGGMRHARRTGRWGPLSQRGGEHAGAASLVGLSAHTSAAWPLARRGGDRPGRGRGACPQPPTGVSSSKAITQDPEHRPASAHPKAITQDPDSRPASARPKAITQDRRPHPKATTQDPDRFTAHLHARRNSASL